MIDKLIKNIKYIHYNQLPMGIINMEDETKLGIYTINQIEDMVLECFRNYNIKINHTYDHTYP